MKKIYIEMPEGYDPPEVEDGQKFEAVVEFQREGKRFCAKSVDGVPYAEKEMPEMPDDMPEESIGRTVMSKMEGYR